MWSVFAKNAVVLDAICVSAAHDKNEKKVEFIYFTSPFADNADIPHNHIRTNGIAIRLRG